jgi:hypothetical protein
MGGLNRWSSTLSVLLIKFSSADGVGEGVIAFFVDSRMSGTFLVLAALTVSFVGVPGILKINLCNPLSLNTL